MQTVYDNSRPIYVRMICNRETLTWTIEYKSFATGTGSSDSETWSWVEVANNFTCPDCADAIDGVAYATFDFVAVNGCEISRPPSGELVNFNVLIHAEVELSCP